MLTLKRHIAEHGTIVNLHEKHGKAKKTGFAFPLTFRCDADTLETICKGWRDSLFRKAGSGEQAGLLSENEYSNVICPELENSAIGSNFTGYEVTMTALGSESDDDESALFLCDVKLASFRCKPYEGGVCDVSFTATCTIDLDTEAVPALKFNEIGKVLLSLTPPEIGGESSEDEDDENDDE